MDMSHRPGRKLFFHCEASPAREAPKNIYSLISLRGIPGSFAPAAACRFSHNESGIFCGRSYAYVDKPVTQLTSSPKMEYTDEPRSHGPLSRVGRLIERAR